MEPKIINLMLAIFLSLISIHAERVHRFFFFRFFFVSMFVTRLIFQRHVVRCPVLCLSPVPLSTCLCLPFSPSLPVHVGYVQCVGVVCVAVCGCVCGCGVWLCVNVVCGCVWLWWWWWFVCGVWCCGVVVLWWRGGEGVTFHDVCFSKPLTFHNGFIFFCFSQLFQALFETSSYTSFTNLVRLEVSKSA